MSKEAKNVEEHIANAERQLKRAEGRRDGLQSAADEAAAEGFGNVAFDDAPTEESPLGKAITAVAEWADELDYWVVQLEVIRELDGAGAN